MTPVKQLCRRSSWKWYGVRSLYRWVALGRPDNPGASFNSEATLVEERIVLFKARSVEEAYRKAKREAKTYASSGRCTNCYGQNVRRRMLDGLDVYELFDSPGPGAEIFSATEEINASVPDERICERPIGLGEPLDQREDYWRRFKFIDVKVVHLLLED
jgi:uncharacterized protein DUF4288